MRTSDFEDVDGVTNQRTPAGRFKYSARSVFLTFPHTNFDKQLFLDHCKLLVDIKSFIIATESHQNGLPHVHACFLFTRKLETRNASFFDYADDSRPIDDTERVRHPHWGAVVSPKRARNYLKKGGDFIEGGWPERDGHSGRDEIFRNASAAATADEAREIIKEGAPSAYWMSFSQIEGRLRFDFTVPQPDFVSPYTPESFTNVPLRALEWVQRYLAQRDWVETKRRSKTLVLMGPSRIGKTCWARSLGPHVYMNGLYNLDKMREGATRPDSFVILDDFEWVNLGSIFKKVIGCQGEFELACKYSKKHTISPWYKPCIFLCNAGTIPTDRSHADIEWWDKNTVFVDCRDNGNFF